MRAQSFIPQIVDRVLRPMTHHFLPTLSPSEQRLTLLLPLVIKKTGIKALMIHLYPFLSPEGCSAPGRKELRKAPGFKGQQAPSKRDPEKQGGKRWGIIAGGLSTDFN